MRRIQGTAELDRAPSSTQAAVEAAGGSFARCCRARASPDASSYCARPGPWALQHALPPPSLPLRGLSQTLPRCQCAWGRVRPARGAPQSSLDLSFVCDLPGPDVHLKRHAPQSPCHLALQEGSTRSQNCDCEPQPRHPWHRWRQSYRCCRLAVFNGDAAGPEATSAKYCRLPGGPE